MRNKNSKALPVALHGMDRRTYKTLAMYLTGPCKGAAVVVEEEDALVDIIDADLINARPLLEARLARTPPRPVIVLSLEKLHLDGVIHVQKPVQTKEMLSALKLARKQAIEPTSRPAARKFNPKSGDRKPLAGETAIKAPIDKEEPKKTSKHQTAMNLDEKGFMAFIGTVPGIDFNDPSQLLCASYNARNHYQGYVQSAYKIALKKQRSIRLDSGWKPLLVLPQNREVLLDADDKQLRAFAGLSVNSISGIQKKEITVSPINIDKGFMQSNSDKILEMDAFLWKLAIWTSRGRYPAGIDLTQPVYLKHWPNFTRYLVTPHAMRIAALLVEGPRTLINTAEVLQIKMQYVFVFFSAAYALGLAGQTKRNADVVVAPQSPVTRAREKKTLLNNILNKLRGIKSG